MRRTRGHLSSQKWRFRLCLRLPPQSGPSSSTPVSCLRATRGTRIRPDCSGMSSMTTTGSLTWWPGGRVVCCEGGRLRVADWGRSTCDLESTPRGLNPGELSAGTIFFGVFFVCVATVYFSLFQWNDRFFSPVLSRPRVPVYNYKVKPYLRWLLLTQLVVVQMMSTKDAFTLCTVFWALE
jgi:hypothetical protein